MNRTNNTYMTKLLHADKKALTRTAYLLSGIVVIAALFAGCSLLEQDSKDEALPPEVIDISNINNASPESLPLSKYGNPTSYVVAGKRYYTMPASKGYKETGIASWYGNGFQGKRTSSGETYDNQGMTAAHRTLPLPTFVKVTNKQNGRSVIVKVNDRGPFHNNRLIDLSYVAAVKLGIVGYGTGLVEITAIDPEEYNKDRTPGLRQAGTQPFIQTGAFQVRKNAERQRIDLEEQGLGPVSILNPSTIDRLYKVQIGPFNNVTEAEQVARTLKPQGINSIILHGKSSDEMVQNETVAMEAYSPEPAPDTSKADAATMKKDMVKSETVTTEPESVTMETEDAGKSTWKFWQWGKTQTGAAETAETATAVVIATPGLATPKTETMAVETSKPDTDATDVMVMETDTDAIEVVVMEADTDEPQTDTTDKAKWKFWKWSKSADNTTEVAATDADESTTETEMEVAVIEIPTPEPAVPETETLVMETSAPEADTATEATTDEASKGQWKFWKWGKTKDSTTEPATAETGTGTMEVTATMMPEPQATQQNTSTVYLQTGAFRLRENAERLRPNVEAIAPGTFNVVETFETRRLYKIEVGPLASMEQAMLVKRELKKVGVNPTIMAGSMNSNVKHAMATPTSTYKPETVQKVEKPVAVKKKIATQKPAQPAPKPVAAAPKAAAPPPKTPRPVPERKMAEMSAVTEESPEPEPIRNEREGEQTLYQQAGAFERRKNADRLQARIVDEMQEPTEVREQANWQNRNGDLVTLHKVQVGPLANKSEAMKVKHALIPMGVDDSFPVYRTK